MGLGLQTILMIWARLVIGIHKLQLGRKGSMACRLDTHRAYVAVGVWGMSCATRHQPLICFC